jgi:prolyl-tRNA editing enzyme YbaK/EbsC (Cys-tRNA(Pro) deacylase)
VAISQSPDGAPTEAPSEAPSHAGMARVADVLAAYGALGTVRELPASTRTAAEAAAALSVDVGAIVKSLVFEADGEPLLVLVSGLHQADTAKIAALLGAERVRRASPELVRSATGQSIGGVAPVGHPSRLHTLVDVALAAYDEVWAAGGHPRAVFPTTYDELLRITGGTPAEVD